MARPATQQMRFTISVASPPKADRTATERERRAVGHVLDVVQLLLTRVPATDLAEALVRVEHAFAPQPAEGHGAALARELAGGRTYSPEERRAIEIEAQLRAFQFRRELLADTLSAAEVADLLGTSRQTPHDRARNGGLLAVLDRGQLRFPRWQFDPAGPDGVVLSLPEVIRVLDVSPLAKMSWLTRPNPYLEDRTPLEALKDGDRERVVDTARAVGMPTDRLLASTTTKAVAPTGVPETHLIEGSTTPL